MTTLRNMEKLTLLKSLLTDSLVKREGLDLLHLMTMILWIKSYVSNLHVTVPSDNTNAYSHGNCMKLNFLMHERLPCHISVELCGNTF